MRGGGGGVQWRPMAVAAATGNRICRGKQFVSKKTGMEVSTMMRIRDNIQKIRWCKVVTLAPVALFVLWTFGFLGPYG